MQIVAQHFRALRNPKMSDAHSDGRTARVSDLEMMLDLSRQQIASLSALVAEAQKEAQDARLMLKEVDHRAKNSLQLAASTLQLQAAEVRDPVAREQIVAAIQRLQSLAAIHAVLYKSADGCGVDMAVWLTRVCDGLAVNPKVAITVTAPPVVWPVAQAGPAGLLAAEAVANALKHAFVDGAGGRITVELAPQGGGRWRLCISDDGVGGAFDSGLGLRLLRLFAEQLGGQLEIAQGEGRRGVTVSTTFAPPPPTPA
jgi:two-component sensor histidine kinase